MADIREKMTEDRLWDTSANGAPGSRLCEIWIFRGI